MPCRLLYFLFCFYPAFLLAQDTVWVKSSYTPWPEFQIFLKSSEPSHLSFAEYQLQNRRQYSKNFKLKEKLLVAQQFYLEGQGEKALKAFSDITDLLYQADWDEEDRRILLYAFLRKAQLEKEEEKRQALLFLVNEFSGFKISPETYSDYGLFPSPLMEELKQIQVKNNFLTLNWNQIFPQHEIILLNGQRIDKNKKVQKVQAYYRVSALSSSHKDWSRKINLSELMSQRIQTKSLTKGACSNLQILEELEKQKIKLFPVSKCPDLDVLALNKMDFEQIPVEKPEPSKKKTASQVPTWVMAGVGVLALSIVLSLSVAKRDDKETDYVY